MGDLPAGFRRLVMVVAVLALLASLALVSRPTDTASAEEPVTTPPNVVVILTDDMGTDLMDALRKTNDLLVDNGQSFTNAIATTALCCPARAALLTGTYAHTNGIWLNTAPNGGWSTFQPMESQTLATALDALGYRTGLFGKYMNEWGRQEEFTPPPGWDTFRAMVSDTGSAGTYYDYDILGTAPVENRGNLAEDYSTDVFAQDTADFIASVPADEPFFAMYTPFAPHAPFTSAPRHLGVWPTESLVPPANERDMTDKPVFMQAIPLQVRKKMTSTLRKQHESLLAVDDAVQQIVDAVGPDRLANTLFVFTSDNGLLNGDHRLQRKNSPYEGATEIPLVLRWDGVIEAGETTARLFTLQDITATIVEASGATLPTEGISWLSDRRTGSVIEGMASDTDGVDRPAYCGWRTSRYLYVRYSDGAGEELYDYAVDPAELRNAIARPDYAGVAETLRANAQAACQPGPPGFLWDPEEPPPDP